MRRLAESVTHEKVVEGTHAVNRREIRDRLASALTTLRDKDRDLLKRNVNERSITHKLAMYLDAEFSNYDVDVEFNRDIYDPKSMPKAYPDAVPAGDIDARTVYPDIIVHRRKSHDDNLLVIEVKKRKSDAHDNDQTKLKFFTDPGYQYKYSWGVHLVILEGNPIRSWFRDGSEYTS